MMIVTMMMITIIIIIIIIISPYHTMKAQRESKGIALPFPKLGA